MYKVTYSKRFKRDLKRVVNSGKFDSDKFNYIVKTLAADKKLLPKHKDHSLKGQLGNFRECHIMPDLLLVYQKMDDIMVLSLLRMGSHSNLF